MATYSASQLYNSAIGAGFNPSSAQTITAISLARGGAAPLSGTHITDLNSSMKEAYSWSKQGSDFSTWPEYQSKSYQKYVAQAQGIPTSSPTPTTPTPGATLPASEVASGSITPTAPTVTSTAPQTPGIGTLLSGLTGGSQGSGANATSGLGALAGWLDPGRIIKVVIGLLLLGGALFLLLAPASNKVVQIAGKIAPEAFL